MGASLVLAMLAMLAWRSAAELVFRVDGVEGGVLCVAGASMPSCSARLAAR